MTNTVNGKQYIGQTCKDNPHERWERHLDTSRIDFHSLSALQKAIMKYGEENFQFEVIDQAYDEYAADQLEKSYVSIYGTEHPNGYNLTAGGAGCLAITSPCDEDDDEPEFDQKEELYGNLLHDEFCPIHLTGLNNRQKADWAMDDGLIQKLLLRVFPKLMTNEKQRDRAGRWIRVIQLYYRMNLSSGTVADEIKMTARNTAKLIWQIQQAQRGLRSDGSGFRKRGFING